MLGASLVVLHHGASEYEYTHTDHGEGKIRHLQIIHDQNLWRKKENQARDQQKTPPGVGDSEPTEQSLICVAIVVFHTPAEGVFQVEDIL